MSTQRNWQTAVQAQCCPCKGYRGHKVFATVRASHNTRFIFADGRTLTVGVGTRYATFPRPGSLLDIVDEAKDELGERFPRTRNLYVTFSEPSRVAGVLNLTTA